MSLKPNRHWRVVTLAIAFGALCFIYLYGLDRAGLIGPDEPRYAAIGRHMAASGDWVMPVLWGQQWFEKPPLLYWMTAIGFSCGLSPDLAPRVPVALLSLAFLAFFFLRLRHAFGERAAVIGTLLLSTSMGWLAASRIAVTDLPLAVTFSAAMLLLMTGVAWPAFAAAGAFLGLAILAKSLVPVVLVLPAIWFRRRRWVLLSLSFAVALAVAAPWHLAVYARAGRHFVDELFWTQQFGRFFTTERQHVQPFWFYVPVMLAAMLPWTPAVVLVRKSYLRDRRIRFLAAWVAWGFVFFSASTNKLPGYILPLLPPLCALAGVALDRAARAIWVIAACAVLTIAFPVAEAVLPTALVTGLRSAQFVLPAGSVAAAIVIAVIAALVERAGRRIAATGLIAAFVAACAIYGIVRTLPAVDRAASVRTLWMSGQRCVAEPWRRELQYGLNYYADRQLPPCPASLLNPGQ